MSEYIGGIELGRTKIVLAKAKENEPTVLIARKEIPTVDAQTNFSQIIDFFREDPVKAVGIGSFGSCDLRKNSLLYGRIQKMSKLCWENSNIYDRLREVLQVSVGLDTDVNAAVLGEVKYGQAQNCDNAVYITVGTEIRIGIYVNGALLCGRQHAEGGHMIMARNPQDVAFACNCRFHANCLEGLASGLAIQKRWGRPAYELYQEAEVWELETDYLAQAVTNIALLYSPDRIILGGDVMHHPNLLSMVREKTFDLLGGYIDLDAQTAENYIVSPGLGDNAGIVGAMLLGIGALEKNFCPVQGNPHFTGIHKQTDNRFINMYKMDALDRMGKPFDYFFASRNDLEYVKPINHNTKAEGVAILARMKDDPQKIVLIRQYRYPIGDYMLELPAGLVDENETPQEAAVREMKEETGLDFEPAENNMGITRNPLYNSQGLTDESGIIVCGWASGEINDANLENAEDIKVVFADLDDLKISLSNEKMSVRAALMLSKLK